MSEDYSAQELKFVEVFLEEARVSGDYISARKKAKEAAGYGDTVSYARIFGRTIELLKEQLGVQLSQMAVKMVNKLDQVIDNPSIPGAKNIISAASTMLDRAGIIKVEKTEVKVVAPNGVLIMPAKQDVIE